MTRTILIIDDERDMQVYLGTLFRRAGYATLVAQNGDEGLDLARSAQPDLITLDLLMPRRSGLMAYEGLRRSPETQRIPIIILTGLAEHQELFGAIPEELPRPDAVVEKPIQRDAFLRQVSELLGA